MFKKQLNEGQAGDNVGLLLRGVKRDDNRARTGPALYKPCSDLIAVFPQTSCVRLRLVRPG